VFVIQQENTTRIAPFEAVDLLFAEVLRQVHSEGVEVHAYRCGVEMEGIEIKEKIQVSL